MSTLRVKDTDVAVLGGRIVVRTWIPDAATDTPPIILLHDSLGCIALWRDFPEMLARRLQVSIIAYDRLGFGQSTARRDLPSAQFIREEAEDSFPAILRALGIADFVLFGHSVGGAMALLIAAEFGPRCRAVISESAQAFVEERTLRGIRAAQAQFRDPVQFAKLMRWHGDKAQWVLRAWTEVWLSPAFASWTLDADLPHVQCPVLVIHGENDEYGSLAFPQRIVNGVAGPVEMVILKECGHVPHRERRDEVVAWVAHGLAGAMRV